MANTCGNWWERRTNLEKTLLSLTVILVVTTAIIIIVTASHLRTATSNKDEGKMCISKECISTAGRIISMADFSADPCQDFYEFACGTYTKTHSVPIDRKETSVAQASADAVRLKLKSWLASASGNNISIYKMAKTLYKNCMNFDDTAEASHMTLTKAISEAKVGEWPVLDPHWDENGKDSLERRLASMILLGVPVAFDLKVIPDIERNGKYITYISPGRPLFMLHTENDVRDDPMLKSFAESVLLLLGVAKTRAAEAVEDILSMEADFIRIKERADQDCGDEQKSFRKDLVDDRLDSYQLMNNVMPELNWTRLMNYVLSELSTFHGGIQNISVHLYCRRFIREFAGHLEQSSPKIAYNYLGWRFLFSFLQHLGHRFYRLHHEYKDHITKRQEPVLFQPRWKECVSLLERHMLPIIAAAYRENEVDENILKEKIQIANNIRSSLREVVFSTEWLDELEKDWLREKVAEAKYEVPLAKFSSKMDDIDQWFSDLTVHHDEHLFVNVLRIRMFEVKKELEKIVAPSISASEWDKLSFTSSGSLQHRDNVIAVHFDKIQFPYLCLLQPSYLNYGSFATYLARELLQYLSTLSLPLRGRGNNTMWDVLEMRKKTKIDSCHTQLQLESHSEDEKVNSDRRKNIFIDGLIELEAVRSSYSAYLQQSDAGDILPGLDFEDKTELRMFFLSYAQAFCEVKNNESFAQQTEDLSSRLRVNFALRNFPKFGETYGCSVDASMNPSVRCIID